MTLRRRPLLLALAALPVPAIAATGTPVTVWRDPSCGCCEGWVAHLHAEGFVLEGHVPALAIRRLLRERPAGIRGLAVPAMPIGAPGMEVPGQPEDSYEVIAFGEGPHRPFMRFEGARPA
jgi:hypothetical protein